MNPQRVARSLGAGALALLLVACGSSQDPADEPAAIEEPAAATATPASGATETPEEPAAEESSSADGPAEVVLDVEVAGDSISPNAVETALPAGGTLTLRITSDRAGEFHVHARPESYVQFGPGETTQSLTFENPGMVEIEEHDTGFAIAIIEVR